MKLKRLDDDYNLTYLGERSKIETALEILRSYQSDSANFPVDLATTKKALESAVPKMMRLHLSIKG